ncbi:hypothetical protein CCM_00174 [Cordyceps militaris CM01]|uniref:Uncharacterized protein n=1 Tax=Cordyceps militaris (strain CM01) TaxID=983644 RepID=G3J7Q4_CORMM|nr:uncharacterized protein CCM_00174 [Cordyceps militaris CM01]EGX95520.1 hypothetical protein CCM_00174 [Cordyceps militaris CM01]
MAPAIVLQLRDTPLAPAEVRRRDDDHRSSSAAAAAASAAVIASPPTENEGTSPPRQKRWATKTRTGCVTCRCMTSGRMCDGYKSPLKKPAKQSASAASHSLVELRTNHNDVAHPVYFPGSRARHAVIWSQAQLTPPDWDLTEALHYYYRTILPSLMANQLDDSTTAYMPTAGNLGCKTSFITFVFSNRIADAAKNRGTLRSPEDMPDDQYLWTAFHASMSTMLGVINERLSSPDGDTHDSVFVRIVDMLSIDLTLLGNTWQAHLHGYGALYKMRGGYKRLSKAVKTFDYQFQYVYMLHVLTSTTTPAAQMLTIFDDLTAEEIHHVFTFTLYTDVPCSSHVFADLIRINRLRALVAAGAPVHTFARPAARQIYQHIAEFSVADWEEPYGVPDKPEARILCLLFQKAVLLYGLLTLPSLSPAPAPADQSSTLPSPSTSGAEAGTHASDGERDEDDENYREEDGALLSTTPPPSVDTLRAEILALIRQLLPLIPQRPTSLAWPLAVVGVTLHGEGDAVERDFVLHILHRISTHRDAYYGPTLCLNKLRKFWASGKTDWEDCYDEACSVLA